MVKVGASAVVCWVQCVFNVVYLPDRSITGGLTAIPFCVIFPETKNAKFCPRRA